MDPREDYIRLPRLYVDEELKENALISFGSDHVHYLRNVMRRKAGDGLRLFNGRDGEWAVRIEALDKKGGTALPEKQLAAQPDAGEEIHLFFAPIKKVRMDFLIEKATELGVTHLHPVLSAYTEVRKINQDRMRQQVIEAAEQCERMDIPVCMPAAGLESIFENRDAGTLLYICAERQDAPPLGSVLQPGPKAFLVGPEGGFSAREFAFFANQASVRMVSLGRRILRAETAALFALSVAASDALSD